MDELFESNAVEELIYARAAEKKLPIYGGFELTPYCNFSCKMCYVQETKPGLPLINGDQWLEFGRQAAEAGTLCIVLTGGEPLLHPDFRKIYTGLKKLGMVLTINTNASLIDEDMADFLAADLPRRVNVSLYGSNEQVYRDLCGNGSGFQKTIRAIELMKGRNVPVKINILPNIINYPYLDEMFDICRKYDLTTTMTSYLFEPLRKCDGSRQGYRLPPEKTAQALLKWDQYRYDKYQMSVRAVICNQNLSSFEESRNVEGTVPLRCRAGNSSFWLCWNGKMNACVNMIRPQADVMELGFAKAWETVKKERDTIRVPAKCDSCSLKSFCLNCAAISFHQYGVFEKEPELMCAVTKHYAQLLAPTVKKIEKKI